MFLIKQPLGFELRQLKRLRRDEPECCEVENLLPYSPKIWEYMIWITAKVLFLMKRGQSQKLYGSADRNQCALM